MASFNKRRTQDKVSGPTTLIAQGCTIEGQLSGDGDFLLSGTVIGDSALDGVVTVAHTGLWKGMLRARHIIINGSVEGDVIASGKLEINASARIVGTVTGDVIAVAEGAVIDGEMQITGKSVKTTRFEEKRAEQALAQETKKAS